MRKAPVRDPKGTKTGGRFTKDPALAAPVDAKEKDVGLKDKITLLIYGKNPKKGTAAKRFELYSQSETVEDYIRLVGNKKQALRDMAWDKKKGWIAFLPGGEKTFDSKAQSSKDLLKTYDGSEEFNSSMKELVDRVPPKLRSTLLEAGVSFHVGSRHSSFSELGEKGTGDHDNRDHWDQIGGSFSFGSGKLTVAEHTKLVGAPGVVLKNRDPEHTFFHELGHAYDYTSKNKRVYGNLVGSDQDEFKNAYDEDLKQIDRSTRERLKYFNTDKETKGHDNGRKEVWAEGFQSVMNISTHKHLIDPKASMRNLGRLPSVSFDAWGIHYHFPRSMMVLKKKMRDDGILS